MYIIGMITITVFIAALGEFGEYWGRGHCGWQSTAHPGSDLDHHTPVQSPAHYTA